MGYQDVAHGITSMLHLETPPVALAFVEAPPAGVKSFADTVPSACTLWRRAETEVFYAGATAHHNCLVGAMVLGFELAEEQRQELMGLVGTMCGCSYLSPDEPGRIPTVKKKKSGIVYGPLQDFPLEPDLILMWLTPQQAMLYSEATGTSSWTGSSPTSALGRPACSALPTALEQERSTLSLGCMGMRTFTEIDDDRMLAVLPGKQGREFLDRLGPAVAANDAMQSFYSGHKAKFAG
jgi:uncharacterized protein (DUF169 family)